MIKEIGRGEILLSKIEISKELREVQELMQISKEDRERLKESIRLHGIRDPLKGYDLRGKFQLLSGWTRLEIGKELGIETVPIITVKGDSSNEYSEFAISENFDRRQLSNEQKRKLIEYKLKNNPEKSDRTIGKETNSDHKTVSKKRKELESRGEIKKTHSRKDSLGRLVNVDPRGEIPQVKNSKKKGHKTLIPSPGDLLKTLKSELKEIEKKEKDLRKELGRIAKNKVGILKEIEKAKKRIDTK